MEGRQQGVPRQNGAFHARGQVAHAGKNRQTPDPVGLAQIELARGHGQKFLGQGISLLTRLAFDGGRHHRGRRLADRTRLTVESDLVDGPMGLRQPAAGLPELVPAVLFMPLLGFTTNGERLGQGGGFYDRALPQLSAWSIGLIHPDEISSVDLPREDFDAPLNAAATPDLILRFN